MSGPTELSFDEILKFMLAHNGKVTNHELVKHFKVFLTDPDMRDEARSTFKKHVNSLAIIKNHNNEKWLILKKKHLPSSGKESHELSTERVSDSPSVTVPLNTTIDAETSNMESEQPPERPPLPLQLNQDLTLLNMLIQDNIAQKLNEVHEEVKENIVPPPSINNEEIPKATPRRRSSGDKILNNDNKSSSAHFKTARLSTTSEDSITKPTETLSALKSEMMLVDGEQKISVKERKQMFNRMASEGDILKPVVGNSFNTSGSQEEDRASVIFDHKSENEPLDPQQKAWILCAARGDYHKLAKMCNENAKLAKTKDPFTGYTAMHWACKRGHEDLVKLLAGAVRNIVNARSNGGYTPLHLAMQYRHENIYKLLVDVYDADPNMLDWSGKKAKQYLKPMDTSLSPGSYRKHDAYNLRKTYTSPPTIRVSASSHSMSSLSKKEGFLRIGSLNVRVKKTTEAFSNFLGVGATRASAYVPKGRADDRRVSEDLDHLHKSWGSADSIAKDDKLMLPPLSTKVRRRGASGRKGLAAAHSRSTPSTPDQPRAQMGAGETGDSDSDSAAGFHSAWRQQRASDCL